MIKDTFTLKDSFPWIALLGLSLGIFVLFLIYASPNFFQAYVVIAVLVVFWAMAARHYLARYEQAKAWEAAPKLFLTIPVFGPIPEKAEEVILCAIKDLAADGFIAPLGCLDGVTLTIVPEPFMVGGILCGETVEGKDIKIVGEPYARPERTTSYLRHATGHIVLSALGFTPGPMGEAHHRIFEAIKYGA
jgi:hypothetical protein